MEDAEPNNLAAVATMATRVLVQTATHLVPGTDYDEKLLNMLDLICQYQWGCDFQPSAGDFRWGIYGTKFAYENRRCYFLIDRGMVQNGDQIRFLWYEWTGTAFQLVRNRLPENVRAKLDSFSFNSLMSERPAHAFPPSTPSHMPKRIRKKIRSKCSIAPSEFDFLAEHPEAVAWLKTQLEPWLWPELEPPETTEEEF